MHNDLLHAAIRGYQVQLAVIEERIADVSRRLRSRRRPRRVDKQRKGEVLRGRWPEGVRPWSAEELDRLREIYPLHSQKKVAEMLGRTRSSVASKAKLLGLGHRRYFSPPELGRIRELYADHSTKEIADELGRSTLSVYQAAAKMGLKKSAAFLKTIGFQKGSQYGVAFQFKKGQTPVNKGVRRPGWAPGRMAGTQFKKGSRSGFAASNWKPIGTVHADPEGFLRVKVRERDPEKNQSGWHPDIWPLLHHQIWEQHNGPIPPGHHVAFKDRDRQNCAIENLELVSYAEMARRNVMWSNYPRELAEVIQLAGVLKRKLRRQSRGEK